MTRIVAIVSHHLLLQLVLIVLLGAAWTEHLSVDGRESGAIIDIIVAVLVALVARGGGGRVIIVGRHDHCFALGALN